MIAFYICFPGLLGAAVLWLAVANVGLAADYARSRDWTNFAGRVVVILLEGWIGVAGFAVAFLFAAGLLRPD